MPGLSSAAFNDNLQGGGSICSVGTSSSTSATSAPASGASTSAGTGAVSSYPAITIGALAVGAVMLVTSAYVLKRRTLAQRVERSRNASMLSETATPQIGNQIQQPVRVSFNREEEGTMINCNDIQSIDPVSTLGFSEISLDEDEDAQSPVGSRISMPSPVRSAEELTV